MSALLVSCHYFAPSCMWVAGEGRLQLSSWSSNSLTHVKVLLAVRNFLIQANLIVLDCIWGCGRERPPNDNGCDTLLLAMWILLDCVSVPIRCLVHVTWRTASLSRMSCSSLKV